MSDLTVDLTQGKLNIRVAAFCEVDNRVLVCRYPDQTLTLPGGRVKFGESTSEALQREIKEELNTTCVAMEYLGVIENFFSHQTAYHEFLFVYAVQLADHDLFQQTETEEFTWLPLKKVKQQLTPQAILTLKQTLTTHSINKESSFSIE
ncbi:NUDIX hydrolase [Enterococcus bulliens]